MNRFFGQVLIGAAKITFLGLLPYEAVASGFPNGGPLEYSRGEAGQQPTLKTKSADITVIELAQRPWLGPPDLLSEDIDLSFSANNHLSSDKDLEDLALADRSWQVQINEMAFASEAADWLSQATATHAQAVDNGSTDDSDDSLEAPAPSEENIDPELGELRIRRRDADPELGILRIREEPLSSPDSTAQRPVAYLTGRVGYINSDNIFLAIDDQLGIVGDDFLRTGAALSFYPALGPETFLLAIAEVNLQRYTSFTSANYDELRFRVGVRQGLTQRTYGEIGWSHQELFRPSFRDRFFENQAFDLTLRRQDSLTEDLSLNSYYRVQLNLSNPVSFDRVIQALGTYGSYSITPQLEVGLNYQLTLADYTQQDRYDTYHQLLGQLVYTIQPTTRLSLFGGISFGRSSEPTVRFDDVIFGVFLESSLVLF